MTDFAKSKLLLEGELELLKAEEMRIDAELNQYFGILAGAKAQKSNLSFESLDIASSVKKLEQCGPAFEAMQQDSRKLVVQVEDCRALSERLSSIVRRLDTMQIRAQQTLACTEDIINLKECKTKIIAAIEDKNLSGAVSYLRQVHEIDVTAAQSSDDYEIIKEKEQIVKKMVQEEFTNAISSSNIKSVMSLCPLLQTLGLESEARDSFLDFVETTVFIAVSADAASVEGTTDPATAYAKSLSNIFNSAYIIIQQYLPMVIQGMENSLGDVHFIRRLHKKCERESGMVLKRYMKFRNLNDILGVIRGAGGGGGVGGAHHTRQHSSGSGGGGGASTHAPSPAQMHTLMDELALLIQYCCRFSKYIRQVCKGAEVKVRQNRLIDGTPAASKTSDSGAHQLLKTRSGSISLPSDTSSTAATAAAPAPLTVAAPGSTNSVVVFGGPTEFDKMVDELVNKYYMEGEQWLMRIGVARALPRQAVLPTAAGVGAGGMSSTGAAGGGANSGEQQTGMELDECFFMLQKCGLRAIATNNIHAACAVLHLIADLVSTELLSQAQSLLASTAKQVGLVLQDHINKFRRGIASSSSSADGELSPASAGSSNSNSMAAGFKTALSLASTFTGSVDVDSGASAAAAGGIKLQEEGGFSLTSNIYSTAQDPWGVSSLIEAFNTTELCVRYTERLSKDISNAASAVFAVETNSASEVSASVSGGSATAASAATAGKEGAKGGAGAAAKGAGGKSPLLAVSSVGSSELDKIRLCREDFDAAKIAFANVRIIHTFHIL
jgi:hypothetical protein